MGRFIIGSLYTHLQLVEGESSSSPDLGVISDGLTVNNGSEETSNGSGGDGLGLLHSLCPPCLLLTGLVEPGLDIPDKLKGEIH